MEESPEASPEAVKPDGQQPAAGSGQVQPGSGPAEAQSLKPQHAVHPRKRRLKHRHRKHQTKAAGLTSVDSPGSPNPLDGRAKCVPGDVKVGNNASSPAVGADYPEPKSSGSQPASPAVLQPNVVYDESMEPPCTLPLQWDHPVLTPPSHARDEYRVFDGVNLYPWSLESPVSPASPAPQEKRQGVAAAENDTTHIRSSFLQSTTIQEISSLTDTILSRENLVVCISIAGVSAVLIGSIIILLFAGGTGQHDQSAGDCTSQSCRRALHDLEELMNYDVDPCHDFYSHVCQRWQQMRETSGDGPISFLRKSTLEFLQRLNRTLSGMNGDSHASADFYNLSKFYQSCELFVTAGAVARMTDILLPFRAYGEELLSVRSFPAVVRYVMQLSLVRGIHTVLQIHLNRFADAVMLRLLRGQTLSQKMDVGPALPLEHYLKEITDGVSNMLGRKFSATEVLKRELRLQKYVAREGGEKRQSITVLENLTVAMGLDEWLNIINAHLPQEYKVSIRSVISIDIVDLIQQVLSLFRGLVDYGVVYLYVLILAEALRFDYLRRVSSNDSERVASSFLRATRLVMRNARNITASHMFPEQSTDVAVSRTFTAVLKSVSVPSTFTWMTAFMRGEAANTLHDVRMHDFRVYPQVNSLEETDRKDAYPDTSDFPGSFIQMKERQQWSLLNDPPAAADSHIEDGFFSSDDVFCDDQSSRVVVPAAVLQEPILYTGDVPQEYVIGSLGVLLARALLRAALPPNSSGMWSPKESSSLLRFAQCMGDLARVSFNASLGSDDIGEPRDVYIWAQSARSAFDALEACYESRRMDSNWESTWRSAQKTFFRPFCLFSCGVSSQKEPLTSKASCVLPLVNMKEFAVAFECPYSAVIQSTDNCALGSEL